MSNTPQEVLNARVNERVRATISDLLIQNITLSAQLDEANATIAKLEPKKASKKTEE